MPAWNINRPGIEDTQPQQEVRLLAYSTGQRWLISVLTVALIAALVPAGRVLLATGFWLLVPGYVLERHFPGTRPHWLVRIVLWNGIGLSVLPILYLWLTAVGTALPPWVLIA
ncbi:MAG: hypothetical protein J7459_16700, partial [Chloroflexus sp.]|nr:hypothetical protein [Chloroflexus sp.]